MIYSIHNAAYKIADIGTRSRQHWHLVMISFKELIDQLGNLECSSTSQVRPGVANISQDESNASQLASLSLITERSNNSEVQGSSKTN